MLGEKDVFLAEELTTNVTSEDYHLLNESCSAIDVKDTVIVWPNERHSIVNVDHGSLQYKQSQNSRKNEHKGLKVYNIYTSTSCPRKKGTTKLMAVTSSNLNRFPKFFYR